MQSHILQSTSLTYKNMARIFHKPRSFVLLTGSNHSPHFPEDFLNIQLNNNLLGEPDLSHQVLDCSRRDLSGNRLVRSGGNVAVGVAFYHGGDDDSACSVGSVLH